MSEEQKSTVVGYIHIYYTVTCPHCGHEYEDCDDKDWWGETFGTDFPCEQSAYTNSYESTCSDCKKEFIITHFEH